MEKPWGIMVNGVPREVQRPNPEGPQAQRVFGRGTFQGTPFIMIQPRLFHIFSFFSSSQTNKEEYLSANGLPME